MPVRAGTAYVDVEGDFSRLNRQVSARLGSLTRQGNVAGRKFGHSFGVGAAAGGVAVALATRKLARFGADAVRVASDVNESLSKNQVLFGRYAKDVERFSRRSADAFGTSRQAALEYTGVFGNLFRALGVSQRESAKFSVGLTKLAADMASFNNTSIDDALEAIRSGLVGETEPLRRFGVNMNDATLRAEALRKGLVKNTKEALTPQTRALAAQSLILKQTSAAHGDFGRTSDQLANSQRRLQARWSDMKGTLGTALLPAVLEVEQSLLHLADDAQPRVERAMRGISDAFARTDLDLGERLALSMRSVRFNLGPVADDIGDGLRAAHLDDRLEDAIRWATPKLLAGFAAAGPRAAVAIWEGFRDAPIWGKVAGGAFLAAKLGVTGPALRSLAALLTGKGTVLSKAAPLPVFVVNQGLPGVGGKGTPVPAPTGLGGRVKPFLKGVGRLGGSLAALDLAINLVDSKGNPISAVAGTAHDLTFGIVPKLDPGQEGRRNLTAFQQQIGALASQGNLAGLERIRRELNAYSSFDAPGGIRKARSDLDALIASVKETRELQRFERDVARTDPVLRDYASNLSRARSRLAGLRKGSDEYRDAAGQVRSAQKHVNDRLTQMLPVSTDVRRAVRQLGINFAGLGTTVGEAASYIVAATNQVLSGLGAETIKFSLRRSKKIGAQFDDRAPGAGHQRGWYVPGSGTGDTVPAMLEPGEYVLNRKAVERLGRSTLDRLNFQAAPRFQGGGIVPIPGQPGEFVHRSILADVLALIRRYMARVTDGYARTGHASKGEHPLGLAVDMVPGPGGSWNLIDQLAHWAEPVQNQPRFPFRWVGYTGDPNHGRGNHVHLSWLRGASMGGAGLETKLKALGITGPDGMLKDIARGAERKMRGAANAFIGRQFAAPTEGMESGAAADVGGDAAAIVKAGLALAGLSASPGNVRAMLTLLSKENRSGSPTATNPTAVNGEHATGFLQMLPSTFRRYAVPGHTNIHNAIDNAAASARYQMARYGKLVTFSPYRLGGLVQLLQAGGEPRVIGSRRQPVTFRNLPKPVKPGHKPANDKVKQRLAGWLERIGLGQNQQQLAKLGNEVALSEDHASRLADLLNTDAIQTALNDELTRRGGTTAMSDAEILKLFPAADQDAVIQGLLPRLLGKTQAEWLQTELGGLLGERNVLLDKPAVLDAMRRQVEDQLATLAKQIKDAADTIEQYVRERDRVKRREEEVHRALAETRRQLRDERRKRRPDRRRIARLEDHESKYRAQELALKSGTHDELVFLGLIRGTASDPFKHSHAWYNDHLRQARADQKARTELRDQLRDSSDDGVVSLPNIASALSAATESLTTIHGIGSPTSKFGSAAEFPVGTLGGTILSVQNQIRDLAANPLRATATAEGVSADERNQDAIKDLIIEQQRDMIRNLRLGAVQLDVLRRFPFGGEFAEGGIVPGPVGAPRVIVAHGGETVLTADESRDRRVNVIISGNDAWLRNLIDVRVEQQTRRQARTAERRLPGRAGMLS